LWSGGIVPLVCDSIVGFALYCRLNNERFARLTRSQPIHHNINEV
jgi:hypothetical protein